MSQLQLRTAAFGGEDFELFNQKGEQIPLPEWEIVYGDNCDEWSLMYPDHAIAIELEPGQYWLIRSNHNVTYVFGLNGSGEEIVWIEIGCVANGIHNQESEVGKVALYAPRPILDRFMELAEIST